MALVDSGQVTPPTARFAISAELVGRDFELARLRDALDGAAAGRGSVVFLAGEAGIGKSRLARAVAADAAERGHTVLWGRAVSGPTPAAYRPLAEALSSAARLGVGPAAEQLGPFRATLGRLVPQWRTDERRPLEESLVAVAEGVLRFLSDAAANGVALLVLEDLHWADPETLAIVEYLADNVAAERVMCVATIRHEGRSAALELARSLRARRASALLELLQLPESDVAAMVASCLASADVPEAVVTLAGRAEGVPFMVEELLAAALSSGALVQDSGSWRVAGDLDAVPPSFAEGMRRRLSQLDPTGQAAVVAAAVLGRAFPWELLPAMTGLEQEAVLAALRDATDAQIVSFDQTDGTFRFRHALSREAVVAGFFPPELERLSRRALDVVESAHPSLEDRWAELAAELAVGAGDRRRAAALFLEIGRRALEQGALASAEATLDRARSLAPPGDPTSGEVDECLLQVFSLAGKLDRAVEVATPLLARLGGDPQPVRRRAEVHLRLARAAIAATQWDEAHAILERARLETMTDPAEDLVARLDAVRAQTVIVRHPEQAPAIARAALEAAERLGLPDTACEALEVLGRCERQRDLDAAEEAFGRALALAEHHGLTVWRARALQELGAIDMLRGRPLERLKEARELAMANGALATAAVVDVQMAAALVLGDDPEAGVASARRSAELSRRYHLDQTLASAVALEAYAHARRRRSLEMQRGIDEARMLAPGLLDIEIKTATAAAVLALVEEDREAARRHLSAGVGAIARAGADHSVAPAVGLLALLRQLDGGDDLPEVEIPTTSVHFLTAALLRYADAVVAGRAGEPDRAAALVTEADAGLRDHRWFRNLGRRLVAEAAIADGWGTPVAWLRESLDLFQEEGDEQPASACRSLLRRAGAAVPRRRGDTGVPADLRALGVTSREVEVLRLLAAGLPNKEIAERLYLSPRTVERHVANLTVKTGVSRRAELFALAARTVGASMA
ncbi:MAG: AAA family ATPase [Actinobacteria bacterium]|nr:AAA family ATPase [Actinomycetota bacterium]